MVWNNIYDGIAHLRDNDLDNHLTNVCKSIAWYAAVGSGTGASLGFIVDLTLGGAALGVPTATLAAAGAIFGACFGLLKGIVDAICNGYRVNRVITKLSRQEGLSGTDMQTIAHSTKFWQVGSTKIKSKTVDNSHHRYFEKTGRNSFFLVVPHSRGVKIKEVNIRGNSVMTLVPLR